VARPPHGCVARHVLEAHPHEYPWWPERATSCGTFHGVRYFRREADHHEQARHEAHHTRRAPTHAERQREERRARHAHRVRERLPRRPHGGRVPAHEQPDGDPLGEQEAVDAAADQPRGDVGPDEDPEVYGDATQAEVQGAEPSEE
jgi:hypothetical protein